MRQSLYAVLLALLSVGVYAAAQGSNSPNSQHQPVAQDQDRNASQQAASPAQTGEAQEEEGEHQKHAKNDREEKAEGHEGKGERAENESLERQVQQQLSTDPALSNVRAEVRGKDVVVLTGTVAANKDRKHAEQLAGSVPGVRKVRDKIKVGSAASAGAATAGVPAGTSVSSTEPATASSNTAGSIAGNTQAQPGTSPMAGSTQIQIQNAVQNQVSGSNVTVNETVNNIVLNGIVPSEEAKERAFQIAQQHAQGKQVINQLVVAAASAAGAAVGSSTQTGTAPSSTGANDLRTQIQQAIHNEPTLSSAVAQNVVVNVLNNNIVLSGTVPSETDKEKVQQVAQQKAGGMQIVNNIQVSSSASSTSGDSGLGATGGVSGTSSSNGPSTSAQTGAGISGATFTAQSANDLKSQIANSLQKEQLTGVIVSVTDTTVELTGTVQNGREKETARRIAQSYAQNRRVVDHIRVTGPGQGTEMNPGSQKRPMSEYYPSDINPNTTNPSPNPMPPHR